MGQNNIKALFVNGGPRKNKNTAQMLQYAHFFRCFLI